MHVMDSLQTGKAFLRKKKLTFDLPFVINTVDDIFVEVAVATLSCTIRPMDVYSHLMHVFTYANRMLLHTSVLTALTISFPEPGSFLQS